MRRFLFLTSFIAALSSLMYAQAPNDECATATVIPSIPYSTTQNTRLATQNAADAVISCNDVGAGLGKTVWFKYTAAKDTSVRISMVGSTPAEYDIMFSVYTGTCGNLTEVVCADDSVDGVIRQPSLFMNIKSGTEYYFLVGEWNGGGTSGGVPTGGDLVFKITYATPPPPFALYLGPKFGTVATGSIVDMSTFPNIFPKQDLTGGKNEASKNPQPELIPVSKLKNRDKEIRATGVEGSNYIEDYSSITATVSRPVIQKGFLGIAQTNSIPPDPISAVGTNHIIVMVNTSFRIFDKTTGNILKTVTAQAFYNSIAPGTGPNDPQIIFDQYSKRFVMLWMTSPTTTDHRHLIAVSETDNAMGKWYMWNTSAIAMGDSVTPGWGDYPALGYDSTTILLTSHQFPLVGSGYLYDKLRVFPKDQLYLNTGGQIGFYDYWNFKDPLTGGILFDIRTPNSFGKTPKTFLINTPNTNPASYVTVWTMSNLTSFTPSITATNIPCVSYSAPQNVDQLGGSGTLKIDGGSRYFRANVVSRDSLLWAVHTIASGTGNAYSAIRYLKIDPYKNKTIEDVALGLNGYWHNYASIAVDKDQNIAVTASRAGINEFIGAYISGRKKNDPVGLSSSVTMKEGNGNYVQDFGSGRNRWGDYMGIGLDPTDEQTFWSHTEYASNKNQWSTWVSKFKIGPLPGSILTINRSFIDFGTKNVNQSSDTSTFTITNDGLDILTVNSLKVPSNGFTVLGVPTVPFNIPSQGSVDLKVFFKPTKGGSAIDTITFTSTDVNNPKVNVRLTGSGFQILTATLGTIYGMSGTTDGGKLYTINSSTGKATLVSATGLTQLASLRVHPTTKELIGFDPTGSANGGAFYRVSSNGSSIQQVSVVNVLNLKGLAFYNDSMAYMGAFTGGIYTVNYKTGVATLIGTNVGLRAGGLAVNPVNSSLWMSLRNTSGVVDAIYKVNTTTGIATQVGTAGVGTGVVDIVFDKNGKLYGLTGTTTVTNTLVVIDTTTGIASSKGELGLSNMLAIALNPDAVAALPSNSKIIPTQFSLEQNYPNPFNPLTTIRFSVPVGSHVVLKVYDALGKEISTLADGFRAAGIHQEYFDASRFASGVYYYKLSAGTYANIKKMMVLK